MSDDVDGPDDAGRAFSPGRSCTGRVPHRHCTTAWRRWTTRLGTAEPRVATPLVYQELAGRLWSTALAPAVPAGRIPGLRGDAM
ncbi:hypothetical protein [Streptomyces sp. NPDC054765]